MLGENIKFYRNKIGLSQQELSEKLHVARPTISSWELNRTEPTMGNIEALANIFRCKKSDLIGENPTTYEPINTIAVELDKEKQIELLIEEVRQSDTEFINRATEYLRLLRYKPIVDALTKIKD
jgi:transcriptional regulator with XRE-family HTH domain